VSADLAARSLVRDESTAGCVSEPAEHRLGGQLEPRRGHEAGRGGQDRRVHGRQRSERAEECDGAAGGCARTEKATKKSENDGNGRNDIFPPSPKREPEPAGGKKARRRAPRQQPGGLASLRLLPRRRESTKLQAGLLASGSTCSPLTFPARQPASAADPTRQWPRRPFAAPSRRDRRRGNSPRSQWRGPRRNRAFRPSPASLFRSPSAETRGDT
jgi:hypothetical protein